MSKMYIKYERNPRSMRCSRNVCLINKKMIILNCMFSLDHTSHEIFCEIVKLNITGSHKPRHFLFHGLSYLG